MKKLHDVYKEIEYKLKYLWWGFTYHFINLMISPFGCWVSLLILQLAVGAFTFNYCLQNILGKDVPWYVDIVAGLFLAEFTLPLAVLIWVLKLAGVEMPLF